MFTAVVILLLVGVVVFLVGLVIGLMVSTINRRGLL